MPTRMDAGADRSSSSVKYMRMSHARDEGYIDLQVGDGGEHAWKKYGIWTIW